MAKLDSTVMPNHLNSLNLHARGIHSTVWLGRGGQGAFTAARLLGLAAVKFAGAQAVAFPSFGPERRGAPVFAFTHLSQNAIGERGVPLKADALVILDESLLKQVSTPFLHEDTLVIVDAQPSHRSTVHAGRVAAIDASGIAREILGSTHTNTILLGFLVGISGLLHASAVEQGIAAEFGSNSRGKKNALAFRHAFDLGVSQREATS